MTEQQKTTYVAALFKFFGKKGDEGIKEFAEELKSLSEEEKKQLAQGITEATFTY